MDFFTADNGLGLIGALVAMLITWFSRRMIKKRNIKRQAGYDAIRDNPDAELDRLGWLSDSEGSGPDHGRRRSDGAPVDYDVSGPSGTLRRED